VRTYLERARQGASRRHVGAEQHRRAVFDVRPSPEQIGKDGFIESLDQHDVRVILDANVTRVQHRDAAASLSERPPDDEQERCDEAQNQNPKSTHI